MYEKILQKLKLQRGTTSNVSDRTLEDLAKSLVAIIATDETLETADFAASIASLDGNINNYTAEQIKKLTPPEKKTEESKTEEDKKSEVKNTDEPPAWAKALLDKVNSLEGDKVTTSRHAKLSEKLKATPDLFKSTVLNSFKRTTFVDEDDFNQYLADIEEQGKQAIQEGQEKGLNFSSPGAGVTKPDPDGLTPEMEKTLKEMTEVKEIKKPF